MLLANNLFYQYYVYLMLLASNLFYQYYVYLMLLASNLFYQYYESTCFTNNLKITVMGTLHNFCGSWTLKDFGFLQSSSNSTDLWVPMYL